MSKMFNEYERIDPDYVPDNRRGFCWFDDRDELTIGATARHTFRLDFPFSEICDGCSVIYRQSIGKVLEITMDDPRMSIAEREDGTSVIEVALEADDTRAFVRHRRTQAQLRLELKSGEIVYGEINEIAVIDPLDDGRDDG